MGHAGAAGPAPGVVAEMSAEPGATAEELLAFSDKIIAAVQERFGVTLEREPTTLSPHRATPRPGAVPGGR